MLNIPPNAMASEARFIIDPSNGAPASARIVGTVYDIEPTGIVFASNALPQLTIDYGTVPNGIDPSTLTIGTQANGQWVDVPGSHVNPANHTVTAPLEHLSPYAVLHPADEPTGNHPPVITNVTIPTTETANQAISFSGSASDEDGDPLTYTWNFGDGSQPQAISSGSATHTYAIAASYTVTLTVTDGHGGTATSTPHTIVISALAGDTPPAITSMIMPTPSSVIAGQPITVTATASDPDVGDLLKFSWNFGDGSASTPAITSSLASHTYATAGSYTVTLTVSDSPGKTATDTRSIVVLPSPNTPPVITSVTIPTTGTAGQSITVSGAASDINGDSPTYTWAFGDGQVSGPTSIATATHTYASAGSYNVTLTVTDGHGGTVTSTAQKITISAPPANQPPIARTGGPYTGTVGQPITFDASASTDPENLPLTYTWNFGDGTSATGAQPTHAYSTSTGSPFTVTVTVTDQGGLSTSATTTTTITTPSTNLPPIARVGGPYSGTVYQAITFDASASSDPEGGSLTYAWNFGDGATVTGTSAQRAHAYSTTTGSPFTVTVTVRDQAGLSSSASTTATITPLANRPPVANAGGPYVGAVGEVLTLSAAGSTDPDGDSPLTYTWNFGDGSPAVMGQPITHAYSTAGTYTVSVTAVDPAGLSNSATTTATISIPGSGNNPPTVSVTVPSSGLVLQNMILRGTASDPDLGDTLSYSWNFGDGASTAFGPAPGAVHEYAQAGTYTATLTVSDGQGHTVAAGGAVAITLPTRPVAFPQSLAILKRYINSASYLYWIAFEIDGAGAPPLRFNIVTYPAHWAAGAQTLGVTAGVNYQWWNPITNTRRPECFTTVSVPLSCKATYSSVVDTTSGTLTMTPSTAPPTVAYLPESCWNWSGLSDSFTFTVTDGNGVTSDPAVVALTMNSSICQPPN